MTQTEPPPDMAADHQVALRHAAIRLAREFDGTFRIETIEHALHTSYQHLTSHAAPASHASTPTTHLPLLAERFARQRLHAVAKLDGSSHDVRPAVLFLCVRNAGRSQMALGFFAHYAGDHAIAWSGGSEPADQLDPAAVAVMAERGIDVSAEHPKPWTDEILRAADVVITMGCGDTRPVYRGTRYEDWPLDDPAGHDIADVRRIRDQIERRVLRLLDQLTVPASP